MQQPDLSRRDVFTNVAAAALTATATTKPAAALLADPDRVAKGGGAQRLSLDTLRKWESLRYGMFIHFGMSTFVNNELPDGKAPPSTYAPDRLDVDQWISVARDAGMKYAVLTTKHVAGHCLWPSRHTRYNVAQSGTTTDVVEAFVKACDKRRVLPGLYYCSWDNHHRFGSRTPSDGAGWGWSSYNFRYTGSQPAPDPGANLPAYTTSIYQCFQTAQLRELLTQYGPIAETWIDIPGVLGSSYRTYLYEEIARLQAGTVIMMNSGISNATRYDVDYAWPSDLIALERSGPVTGGYDKWRTIEGKQYYMPGEICDPIGKNWFWVQGDAPRSVDSLVEQIRAAWAGGVNMLLDVPPDRHGRITDEQINTLRELGRHLA